MGKKTNATLWLDEENVQKAKTLGINISRQMDRFLETLVSTGEVYSVDEIKFIQLQQSRDDLQQKVNELQEELKIKEVNLQGIIKEVEDERPLIENIKKARQISKIMQHINYEIDIHRINPEDIWKDVQPQVEMLEKLGFPITKEWLDNHILRKSLL